VPVLRRPLTRFEAFFYSSSARARERNTHDGGHKTPKHLTNPRRASTPTRTDERGVFFFSLRRPSEPILFPKVRIQFADFPYLHSSKPPEAANLGDLMRIWVRSGAEKTKARDLLFRSARIFKDRQRHLGHHGKRGALRIKAGFRGRARAHTCKRTHTHASLPSGRNDSNPFFDRIDSGVVVP
jgi:hypothetical protein